MKMDTFLEIEKKYGLINDTVEGMYYWNLSRFDIFQYRILEKKLALSPAHSGKRQSVSDKIKHKIMLYYYSLFYSRIKNKNVDVCFVNHPRRVKNGDFYDCIYTERLTEFFDNCIVIEKPYLDGHLRPVKTKNLVYTDKISLDALRKLKKTKQTAYYDSVREQISKKLRKPLEELASLYEVEINVQKTIDFCTEKAVLSYLKKEQFMRWLEISKPKVIVETVYYNRDCMAINEAAKELSIPIIELQHGTMGELHNAYQFPEGTKLKQLPDKILTFSEFWNNMVHIPGGEEILTAVGFPYFEEQIKKYQNKDKQDKNHYIVLFVSQGTIGAELSKFAAEFSETCDERVKIIFKLHPSEYSRWTEQYSWLIGKEIEVIDNNEKSIYELFSQSDVQVGVYSTAIYEGMAFGLKTYIYDMAMADTMYKLCEAGYATLVQDAQMLSDNIFRENSDDGLSKDFWKTNSFHNIVSEIKKYIEG